MIPMATTTREKLENLREQLRGAVKDSNQMQHPKHIKLISQDDLDSILENLEDIIKAEPENETEKTTAYLEGDCPCGGGHPRKDHYGRRADLTGKEPGCPDCGGGLNAILGVQGREICRKCKQIFVTNESAKRFDRENRWGFLGNSSPVIRVGRVDNYGPVERIVTKSQNLSKKPGVNASK